MTPIFFISETSNLLSGRSRSLKKIYRVEHFRANVIKWFNMHFFIGFYTYVAIVFTYLYFHFLITRVPRVY